MAYFITAEEEEKSVCILFWPWWGAQHLLQQTTQMQLRTLRLEATASQKHTTLSSNEGLGVHIVRRVLKERHFQKQSPMKNVLNVNS